MSSPASSADRPDSLPTSWVERIFEKLALVYGRDFIDRWPGMSVVAVQAEWARELAAFTGKADAIGFALRHLPPSRPPTVIEFRDLCNRAPEYAHPELPAPKPDPERLKRVMSEAMSRAQAAIANDSPYAWAHRLQERIDAGLVKPTQAQREMVRDTLARERRGSLA